jgi:hypothetical protein
MSHLREERFIDWEYRDMVLEAIKESLKSNKRKIRKIRAF